jgi:para-nitrobenzyl esterase
MHGFEIPCVFDIPAALVGGNVTGADKAMGELTSAYWVSFAKTGDPNGGGRTQWPRDDPAVDQVINLPTRGGWLGRIRSRRGWTCGRRCGTAAAKATG